MKNYFIKTLAATFSILEICAQTLPTNDQLNALPADKIWELYAENVEHRKVQLDMLRSVLKSEREDIISPFFRNPYTRSDFFDLVSELPDSAYKNKIGSSAESMGELGSG